MVLDRALGKAWNQEPDLCWECYACVKTCPQTAIDMRGYAIQCRITTEDPANGFRPDTGRISALRTPGGAGIRLDGSTNLGAEISAHFDSMLVKLTCRGRDFQTAVSRARRAIDTCAPRRESGRPKPPLETGRQCRSASP